MDPNVQTVLPSLVLGCVFSVLMFKEDDQRVLWRVLACISVVVGSYFIYLGSTGIFFGCLPPLALPIAYFGNLQRRQYGLRDVLLFVLLMGSMVAAAVQRGDAL